MSKTNKCSLQNEIPSICDDIINGTILVTERVKIPETNLDMNLVEKELCRHHYNKLSAGPGMIGTGCLDGKNPALTMIKNPFYIIKTYYFF
jgi:hypothetical protein